VLLGSRFIACAPGARSTIRKFGSDRNGDFYDIYAFNDAYVFNDIYGVAVSLGLSIVRTKDVPQKSLRFLLLVVSSLRDEMEGIQEFVDLVADVRIVFQICIA